MKWALSVLSLLLCVTAAHAETACRAPQGPTTRSFLGPVDINDDGPSVDVLNGEKCPDDPIACKVIATLPSGNRIGNVRMSIDLVAWHGAYACISTAIKDENGEYINTTGWIRRDQIALQCNDVNVTGEAEIELAHVVRRRSGIELFSGDSCPRDESKCKSQGLNKAPAAVIVIKRLNGHACIQFGSGFDYHSGWVKSDRLRLFQPAQTPIWQWSGRYHPLTGEGQIDITASRDGTLKVAGAILEGSGDGGGFSASVYEQVGLAEARLNLGTLTIGPVRVVSSRSMQRKKGDLIWDTTFEIGPPRLGCVLILRRVGDFLVVKDTPECMQGIFGTGFEGVWTQTTTEMPKPVEDYVERVYVGDR